MNSAALLEAALQGGDESDAPRQPDGRGPRRTTLEDEAEVAGRFVLAGTGAIPTDASGVLRISATSSELGREPWEPVVERGRFLVPVSVTAPRRLWSIEGIDWSAGSYYPDVDGWSVSESDEGLTIPMHAASPYRLELEVVDLDTREALAGSSAFRADSVRLALRRLGYNATVPTQPDASERANPAGVETGPGRFLVESPRPAELWVGAARHRWALVRTPEGAGTHELRVELTATGSALLVLSRPARNEPLWAHLTYRADSALGERAELTGRSELLVEDLPVGSWMATFRRSTSFEEPRPALEFTVEEGLTARVEIPASYLPPAADGARVRLAIRTAQPVEDLERLLTWVRASRGTSAEDWSMCSWRGGEFERDDLDPTLWRAPERLVHPGTYQVDFGSLFFDVQLEIPAEGGEYVIDLPATRRRELSFVRAGTGAPAQVDAFELAPRPWPRTPTLFVDDGKGGSNRHEWIVAEGADEPVHVFVTGPGLAVEWVELDPSVISYGELAHEHRIELVAAPTMRVYLERGEEHADMPFDAFREFRARAEDGRVHALVPSGHGYDYPDGELWEFLRLVLPEAGEFEILAPDLPGLPSFEPASVDARMGEESAVVVRAR